MIVAPSRQPQQTQWHRNGFGQCPVVSVVRLSFFSTHLGSLLGLECAVVAFAFSGGLRLTPLA
eukprot:scaffold466576_cov49-Prasinocladus_malaysianus.AAC.4